MAYVRKVRTASGAVAVQVARKEAGKVVIIEHVGSAHTDAELGVLLQRARGLVDGLQEVLDLEVARRVARLDQVPDWRPPEHQQRPVAHRLAGPGHTVATSSRLLYQALGAVYDALGFHTVGDAVFKDLVIARIVEPSSKLDSARVLTDLGVGTGACHEFCVSPRWDYYEFDSSTMEVGQGTVSTLCSTPLSNPVYRFPIHLLGGWRCCANRGTATSSRRPCPGSDRGSW